MGKSKGHGKRRAPGVQSVIGLDVVYRDLDPEETWEGGPKIAASFGTVRDVLMLAPDPMAVAELIDFLITAIDGENEKLRLSGSSRGSFDFAAHGGIASPPDPENGHIYIRFRSHPTVMVNAANQDRITRWFRVLLGLSLAKFRRDLAIAQN